MLTLGHQFMTPVSVGRIIVEGAIVVSLIKTKQLLENGCKQLQDIADTRPDLTYISCIHLGY